MEKNNIAFIGVCLVFYLAYSQYLNTKYPDRFKHEEAQTTAELSHEKTSEANSSSGKASDSGSFQPLAESSIQESVSLLDPKELTLENDEVQYIFNQVLGGIEEAVLKKYFEDDKHALMKIVGSPLKIRPFLNHLSLPPKLGVLKAKRIDSRVLEFSELQDGFEIVHRYQIPEKGYGLETEFIFKNLTGAQAPLEAHVHIEKNISFVHESKGILGILPGMPALKPSVVGSFSGSIQREDIESYCKDGAKKQPILATSNNDVELFGFDLHYFLIGFSPELSKASVFARKSSYDATYLSSCDLIFQHGLNFGLINSNETASLKFKTWLGPKVTEDMTAFSSAFKTSMDFGFFNRIGEFLLDILKFVYQWFGNWGVAIILFTTLLKILFYPMTRSAHISMSQFKKLQPEMNKIKEKYKNDPEKQRVETMRFMSSHKVNPMKGCLPPLAQIPVFFAFYRVLSSSIELRHAPFFGWITDLSASDPYYITPVLLGVAMFISMKLTPTTGMDKTQERIMRILPLAFGVMMLSLPAGLVLYMLTNTLVSIAQQQWLNHKYSPKVA